METLDRRKPGQVSDREKPLAKVLPLTDKSLIADEKMFWDRTLIRAVSEKNDGGRISGILKKGADVDAKDELGMTALMYAIRAGNKDNVKVLLDNGADVNARDSDDMTPLMDAAIRGDTAIVLALIERGADVNAMDRYGKTARRWAENEGNREVSELICIRGR